MKSGLVLAILTCHVNIVSGHSDTKPQLRVAHSKRWTRFTLRRPRLFGTKLTQWILL